MSKHFRQRVSVDLCGPFPTGGYLLVIIDDKSHFPEADIVTSTLAHDVTTKFNKIFSTFGIPELQKADNGRPFNREHVHQFTKYMGCQHRKVTPYWP